MTQDHFMKAYRRAAEIRWRALIGFAALRAAGDELNAERRAMIEIQRELSELRSHPQNHGSTAQRQNIARLLLDAENREAEQRAEIEVLSQMQAEAQEVTDSYGPQREECLRLITQMRDERDATAAIQGQLK